MNKNDNQNIIDIKILTIGDSNVGKSSLIIKYIENKININYLTTIGFDLKYKIITLKDGTEAKIILYDNVGQERFKSLSKNYIKKANGALLVYDICNRISFESIYNWKESIYEENNELPVILVGNKQKLND